MRNLIHLKTKWKIAKLILLCLICLNGFESCTNGSAEINLPTFESSDPNQPVIFTDYSPKEGSMGTRLFITGQNFGTDISLINVTIGGEKAKIISSTGEIIYCQVPPRADEGAVEVEIKNIADESKNTHYVFEQQFTYKYNTAVATLCGVVDKDGKGMTVDGGFDVAGFANPMQMTFDDTGGERNIYLFDGFSTMRKINLDTEEASTIVTTSNCNWEVAMSFVWSADRDTLFTNNVNDASDSSPGFYYFLRDENFSVGYPGVGRRCIYMLLKNPVDHELFMLQTTTCTQFVSEYDSENNVWNIESKGTYGAFNAWCQYGVFHPSGKFAYIMARGHNCILKAYYDSENKKLENTFVFAGAWGPNGYEDGTGQQARFDQPIQGCFVKNEEYVKAGKEDVYDFYVTDYNNHCIRKITPEGIVSTYAGRGSWSTDEQRYGYIDGDLRQTARFKYPWGICYDETNQTFYISDSGNYRIRMIAIQ